LTILSYPLAAGPHITRVLQAGLEGPPVVLLHGVGSRADRFRPNLEAMAGLGLRAYAVDLTGHGFATKGRGPDYDVAGWTRQVVEVINALGLGRVTLVGTSLGAQIAGRLTVDDPDRIQGLMLIGPLGLVPIGPSARQALAAAVRRRSREDIRSKLEYLLGDPSLITEEWIEEEWRINNSPGATDAFDEISTYMAERVDDDLVATDLAPLVGRIPTTIVWGGADRMVPTGLAAGAMEALGGGANLQLMPGLGHAPYYEDPEGFQVHFSQFCRTAEIHGANDDLVAEGVVR
jgi:2-hydroxy-6-oxonona-2,4-dienedioate hydrolase